MGHVAIRAGTKGMSGAAALSAQGALRGGAGLVTVLTDAEVADVVASQIPEAMVRPWEGALPDSADVLLVGPGGVEEIPEWSGPLVLDASALQEGQGPRWMARPSTGLTPHAGEHSRLFNRKVGRGVEERLDAINRLPKGSPAVLILKGAQTLITGGGSDHVYVNPTGHNGLSSGGTGDFLAGVVAARLARNAKDPLGACCEAVWLHGAAADRLGLGPLTASDLGTALAQILRELHSA
jgi:NAD(P)H-hydrate epimerase